MVSVFHVQSEQKFFLTSYASVSSQSVRVTLMAEIAQVFKIVVNSFPSKMSDSKGVVGRAIRLTFLTS